MDKYLIIGETPSKKNQKRIFARGSKVIVLPSENYEKWHESALLQIRALVKECINEPCYVILIFTHGDNRKRDSDNGTSSIFDTLQDAKIIEDDCWQIVRSHHVFNNLNLHNPSCEIHIYKQSEIEKYLEDLVACAFRYS